ncbi:MAG: DNA repair protein RecO [Clostridia bacterium]|nr:DNA repair protein RecO [Clostridia bacterium]
MVLNESVSALVIRRADWRDYDRIVTLLTRERGRVEAAVRGCRRPKSELMNAAEPFVCGQYQLYFNHGRFTVTQCRVTDGFYPLREDMERLTLGAAWLRLLEEVSVPEEPAGELFELALSALTYLAYSDTDQSALDLMFKLKLCLVSGFAPSADACAVCGRSARETALGFDARRGGCVCRACALQATPLGEGARRILFKAPRAPFKSVQLLSGHPDVNEALLRTNEFLDYNVARIG